VKKGIRILVWSKLWYHVIVVSTPH